MKGALFSIFEGTLRPQEEAAAAASQKKQTLWPLFMDGVRLLQD